MSLGTTLESDAAAACCARCGYDLRGSASDRCPECGAVLAGQRALVGAIPWTYRRVRGRVRAFAQTAWDVARGAPWTRAIVAGPVALRDAERFWRVAVALAAAPPVVAFLYAWYAAGGLWFLKMMPVQLSVTNTGGPALPPWWTNSTLHEWLWIDALPALSTRVELDGFWPLSAGWTTPGVGPAAIALAVLLGSGAAAYAFHPRSLREPQRSRLAAYAYYLIGATLVVAAAPLTLTLAAGGWSFAHPGPKLGSAVLATFLGLALTAIVLFAGYLRALATIRRATHRWTPTLVAAAVLPIACTLAATFALVVLPWSVGYARLLIDAMRP